MFEVSVISCIVCMSLYLTFRYILIPVVLKVCGERAQRYFKQEISEHEQQHHAQVAVCFLHSIFSAQGAIRCVLPYHFKTLENGIVDFYQTMIAQALDYDAKWIPIQTAELLDLRWFYIEATLGYFIADTIIYFWYIKNYPIAELLHHVISIASYIIGRITGVGTFGMITLQTNEITTPLLHFRYFLNQWKVKNKLYEWNLFIFFVMFFFCRVIYDSFIFYSTVVGLYLKETDAPQFPKIFQTTSMIIYCLIQYFWFFVMLRIAILKLFKSSTKEKKKQK